MANEERMSIYRASRSIKRKENSLYNALRSIYEDSIFVAEIAELWRELPLVANLRCGLWYSSSFDSTCYFKSTDGHCNNCSFSTARLNLHIAQLAGKKGGCIIVDSTRKGKRFPDSMSKTIPIWACVLNRAIKNHLQKIAGNDPKCDGEFLNTSHEASNQGLDTFDWDCSLHLPLWVSKSEKAAIEDRLEEWTKQLEATGTDIASLASSLRKPLRALWISPKTVIWLNEVPDSDSWDFTPIILVSASFSNGVIQQTTSEFSWHYISGAGDDEESWARGLSPPLFWKHVFDLINAGPDLCNQQVAEIVEKDRVYRAQRGQSAPQVTIKPPKMLARSGNSFDEESNIFSFLSSEDSNNHTTERSLSEQCLLSWLGTTNLAVGTTQHVVNMSKDIDCVLNCDIESASICFPSPDAYLHLAIVTSKVDRFSLLNNLPSALNFSRLHLSRGKKLLVCCPNGEDISICVSLAILTSLFDDGGSFDNGKSFKVTCITKWEMRRRLVFICKYATHARPSRGNLKQIFGFLSRDKIALVS